ncbi:MAG: response regulator [Deltaproteobacteria bacterium]|nr:response regulator [Deltaproteobacteria bacterium]
MQAAATSIDRIKIMLVDDDDSVREAVAEILSRRGWDVDAFDNAEKGVEALRNGFYDVVLADINMPGLSGMDFLQQAKENAPEVPFIIITGYPSIDLAVEAMKIGAVDFLAKPFKAEELEVTVRKAVSESKVANANRTAAGAKIRAIGNLPEIARRRLEDKIKELSILHTISESLDEVNEKEDIFRKTMDIAQIIADSDKSFIMVVEGSNKELVIQAASGYEGNSVLGKRFLLDQEPFQSVIKNRCYSYSLVENDHVGELISTGGPNKRKPLLLAPMVINREVVVLLGLAGKEGGAELTNDALTLLLNLTAKASLKLENIALSENIFSSIIGALNSLINALDARDTYTKDHSNRVTQYALHIAKSLNCRQDVIDSISFAGPLHDIGKIGVRDEILLKKGSFTIDEREIMKSHVVRGEEILRPLNLLTSEKAVVLYHHERWDGQGYPNGLAGTDIPEVARIFSVADTFDAMTSSRPYRQALSFDVARDEIHRCRGTQFDPIVVDAFLECDILKGKDNG